METEKDDKKSQDMGKETCDAITAATKIQAGFRGYKVRKQMKVKKVRANGYLQQIYNKFICQQHLLRLLKLVSEI